MVRCIIIKDTNLNFHFVNIESTQVILLYWYGFCFKEVKLISFVTNSSLEPELFVISKKLYDQKYNKSTVYFIKISHISFAKRCGNYKTIISNNGTKL